MESTSTQPDPALSSRLFHDIPALLERSAPRPGWLGRGWMILALVGLGSVLAGSMADSSDVSGAVLQAVSGGVSLLMMAGLMFFVWFAARALRQEQQRVRGVEELVMLRRWPEAALALDPLLRRPMRQPVAYAQSLLLLSSVLLRYERFEDAIAVHDHLLAHFPLDPGISHRLRVNRAMAMLRMDHLVDADRAMGELRREVARAQPPQALREKAGPAETVDSAGLILLDMYRDVKTGHAAEAVELFEAKLKVLREQLAFRVADAYALAARAYQMLQRDAEAKTAWENATVLSPVSEISRRYPEVAPLSNVYAASMAPVFPTA